MSLNPNLLRRAELQDELVASDAYQLVARLRTFELSLEIFHRNFRDLEAAIQRHMATDVAGVIRIATNHQLRHEDQIEMTRHLHNFVAAAMSLVDHTRVFYHELYEPQNVIPDYQEQINNRFVTDKVANFVKCLRQFCQHYRLPLIATQLRIDVEQQEIESGVSLRKQDLLQFSAWTRPAKDYLDNMPDQIELIAVFADYRDRINDFYRWFKQKQRDVHKTELEYYDATVAELRRLAETADS